MSRTACLQLEPRRDSPACRRVMLPTSAIAAQRFGAAERAHAQDFMWVEVRMQFASRCRISASRSQIGVRRSAVGAECDANAGGNALD